MTGQWEKRLQNIATGGSDFDVPSAAELHSSLEALTPVLQKAAADPGITGESGLAATAAFDAVAKHAAMVSQVAKQIQDAAEKANAVRSQAARDLSRLPGGSLSSGDETLVRAAAAGATILFPGFSVIAGDGAVGAINWFLGNQRESHAQTAVRNASDSFDRIAIPMLPGAHDRTTSPVTQSTAPGSGSEGPGPSYRSYPGWNDDPLTTHAVPAGLSVGTGLAPIPRPGDVHHGDTGSSSDSLHPVVVPPGGSLNVDGPTASGSTTLGPGGSSVLGPGSGSGGLLGHPSSALIAGGGSAALLGGGRMAAAGGFGGARGFGAAGLGGPGAASGMGSSTVGPNGPAAARGGGLLGRAEAGGAANANNSAAAGGRPGAGSGAMGAGSRGGEHGSRSRNRGRGLGGPMAPQLEEDAEIGPRSEAAGAGGRDEMSEL
ncbi:hypothetical protein LK09_13140 [Microbacterium mangrovi]|uniref:Uncharacterized protein n=1 Tax=Microbacterium mangrovi TaxID=1348253 RepID=A0A0B2A149_9MICO|nr:hypothetical protein [Microbacterium mangrovi]KHK97195.1 hypothetical protein LK09_13140 [Microbacterium mangrovi]